MKEKKDCKIVQDLLPSYIEKLTNEESNKFIEEHLKICDECKKILENMKKELNVKIQETEKKEVNYIKKYNKKLRILKIILLVILAVFVIRTGRNMIIMTNMSNKADKYIASNNYYRRSTGYSGNNLNMIDYYYKDGKSKMVLTTLSAESNTKITVYNNGKTKNMYIENGDKKIAQLNTETLTHIHTINYFNTENNILLFIIGGITANIKSVECNGKHCYLVNNYFSDDFLGMNMGTYIDKETGLVVRNSDITSKNPVTGFVTSNIHDINYSFGTVTDDIFIEPDISQYEVK